MNMPDITGYTLGDGKRLLEASGIRIGSIIVTDAPRNKCTSYDDSFRIIRCRALAEGCVELLICKDMNM